MNRRGRLPLLAAVLASLTFAAAATGCSDGEPAAAGTLGGDEPRVGFDTETVDELEELGWGKYIGRFAPTKVTGGGESATTIYTFGPDPSGPICLDGTKFAASIVTRESDDLLIYLQGGGACWTGLCAAKTTSNGHPVKFGFTDGDAERNPLGAMNLLFIDYCDGSVFVGDGETSDPSNGAPDGIRYQHGLANLTAALDVGHERYPQPTRIVLAGSSAGGYGTIAATLVVRLLWPHTPLFVINDAGIGLVNPNDSTMYDTIVKEWNVEERIPPSCRDCNAKHGFAPLVTWALDRDPTIEAAAFSAYEDAVIGGVFLKMKGPELKALLLEETGRIHDAHPDRYRRFMIEGATHTALLSGYYDLEVNGVGFAQWTGQMIDGEPGWTDLLENGGN